MNFNELYETAYSQNLHHEPRKFVEFYDQNRILIEGQNVSKDPFIYDRVTHLRSDYAHCLVHNESHKRAKPEIEASLKLYESHPDYKGNDLLDIKYYETLIFDRAVVNYYAKNYKEAIQDLILLTQKFPNDEKFQNWLKAAKAYKLNQVETVLYFTAAGTIIADVFLDDLNPILDKSLTIGLVASLIGIGAFEFIKWNRKKTT